MDTNTLFTAALGLSEPWQVEDIRFDIEEGKIHFDVICTTKKLQCPHCHCLSAIHDRKRRSWQHLHFFQYRAFIHADVPRVGCEGCGKTTQVSVPWSNKNSGFTLLMQAFAIMLAKTMPVAAVAKILGVNDPRLWRVITSVVEQARAKQSHANVSRVGVDEKHIGKAGYITLFHDCDAKYILFIADGKKGDVFEKLVKDMYEHKGDAQNIEAVSMDMSVAFRAGATKHLPNAQLCFDYFHLIQMANKALDQVRKQEVKSEIKLKGKRWGLLKDESKWTDKQAEDMHWMSRSKLQTARAWRLKESLRDTCEQAKHIDNAIPLFNKWISWARRSRLEPMKKLAATVKNHLQGIINSFTLGMSNGTAESLNSKIQAVIARARGFRSRRNLAAIIYLNTAKLTNLPNQPFPHKMV